MTRQVLNACCQTIRAKVLSKVSSNDLNIFQGQIQRLNAEGWDDIHDLNTTLQRADVSGKDEVTHFLTSPYTYMARIQVKYELQTA